MATIDFPTLPQSEATYFAHSRVEVAQLIPSLAPGAVVLEIGCGEGNFSRHFAAPRTYWGIEPSPVAAEVARGRLDHVLVGTYRDVVDQLPDRHFDCIVCNDVIEHMDDHDWFLQAIKSKMRAGAIIVGSIPNVRHISNVIRFMALKDWQYVDSGILDRTHLRFFTERSLKRALLANGYTIEAFRGINASTFGQAGSIRQIVVEAGKALLVLVVGLDTRFPQFAFRVTPS